MKQNENYNVLLMKIKQKGMMAELTDMKFKKIKALFMKCLEDDEICRRVREVASESTEAPIDISVQEYKAEIERLQTNCDTYRKNAQNAKQELKAKTELADSQAEQLSDLTVQLEKQCSEMNIVQGQRDWYKGESEHFKLKLSELNEKLNQLESNANSLENKVYKLQNEKEYLAVELEHETAAKKSLQSLLVQCFGEGYTLYQKYQQISPYTQKLLSGVFRRNDFEGFIVGGCQPDALERIWDVLKCRIGDPELPILWQIFAYLIVLCNKSSKEDIYAIENTQPGDEYAYELHSPDQSSKAQGKITEVKLQGYKNIFRNKFVRKSIVHVE